MAATVTFLFSHAARHTNRPIRPKPLIPIRTGSSAISIRNRQSRNAIDDVDDKRRREDLNGARVFARLQYTHSYAFFFLRFGCLKFFVMLPLFLE